MINSHGTAIQKLTPVSLTEDIFGMRKTGVSFQFREVAVPYLWTSTIRVGACSAFRFSV